MKKFFDFSKRGLFGFIFALLLQGCATSNQTIAGGALAGAAVGAGIGYNLGGDSANHSERTTKTIISSVLFGLLTGGFLAWHYRALEQEQVNISGRYSRMRLCDSSDADSDISKQLGLVQTNEVVYQISPEQIGELALWLDDETKWAYPRFRKRYLNPERTETQVVSRGYVWEIVRPGYFLTRSQNSEYFRDSSEGSETLRFRNNLNSNQ